MKSIAITVDVLLVQGADTEAFERKLTAEIIDRLNCDMSTLITRAIIGTGNSDQVVKWGFKIE